MASPGLLFNTALNSLTTEAYPDRVQAKEALEARVDVVIATRGGGTVGCFAEVLASTGTAMGLVPLAPAIY